MRKPSVPLAAHRPPRQPSTARSTVGGAQAFKLSRAKGQNPPSLQGPETCPRCVLHCEIPVGVRIDPQLPVKIRTLRFERVGGPGEGAGDSERLGRTRREGGPGTSGSHPPAGDGRTEGGSEGGRAQAEASWRPCPRPGPQRNRSRYARRAKKLHVPASLAGRPCPAAGFIIMRWRRLGADSARWIRRRR